MGVPGSTLVVTSKKNIGYNMKSLASLVLMRE